MTAGVADHELAIWNRTIQPENGTLTPEAARAFLELSLPPEDLRRVTELSAKARDGTLTAQEGQELDNYLNVGRTLEFLKAKARFSLQRPSRAA